MAASHKQILVFLHLRLSLAASYLMEGNFANTCRRSGAAQSPNTRISTAQRAKVVPLHLSLEASQEAGVPTTRVSDASAKLQEEQEQPNAGRLKALTPAQVCHAHLGPNSQQYDTCRLYNCYGSARSPAMAAA